MMDKDSVTIDGVMYVKEQKTTGVIRIVLLQRGWNLIGRYSQVSESECTLSDASVIRNWGTTKGLGQLAMEGKQPNTKLDPCPTVRFHPLVVIGTIDCSEEVWECKLR